jgi:hypothetical protein
VNIRVERMLDRIKLCHAIRAQRDRDFVSNVYEDAVVEEMLDKRENSADTIDAERGDYAAPQP